MPRRWLLLAGLLGLALAAQVEAGAPSTGTIEVAVILAEFQDLDFDASRDAAHFEALAFGGNASLHAYYDEVSQGALDIQGDVFGPYTLDGNASDYGPENTDFVRDAVAAADGDIDFRDYDAVMAVHAGPGEESSSNSDDIWSIHWTGLNIATNDGGHRLTELTQVPEYEDAGGDERSPLGVWSHEFGHELGLPDLYDTDDTNGGSEGIGNWGVMASGSWLDNGETPGHFSAWSKVWLGWNDPVVITGDVENVVLEPVETGGAIYQLPIPGNWSDAPEYFLLENRQEVGYDAYLPGTGLLIWHVNETTLQDRWGSNSVNNDETRKGVDLEAADGDDDMDHEVNQGDGDDPWTTGSFTATGYPNSRAYNGSDSGWRLQNIEVDGDNVLFDILFLSKPHAVADADEAVVLVGEALQFYGNDSWDDDGEIVNFTWDFDDGSNAFEADPAHTFDAYGTFEVTLTVTDDNGLSHTATVTIYVNAPPVAVAVAEPVEVQLGGAVFFNGSGSYDPDGMIAVYYWNFDDGFTANQAEVSHTYRDSGSYNVSFKVMDNLNTITTIHLTVTVLNDPPVADFAITPPGGDTTLTFVFQDNSTDSDGSIVAYQWDFGDGNFSAVASPTHRYALPGRYTVTLRVTDDQGANASFSETLDVTNALPELEVALPQGVFFEGGWVVALGETLTIDGGGSRDPEGLLLTWNWTLDGATYDESGFTATLGSVADYELVLNLSDAHGGWVQEAWLLKADIRPVVALTADPLAILVNDTLTARATVSQGAVAEYVWDLAGAPGSDDSASQEFVSAAPGAYELAVIGYTTDGLPSLPALVEVQAYAAPVAAVNVTPATLSQNNTARFNGNGSLGENLSYHWWLDGLPLSGDGPHNEHRFANGGWHNLTLFLTQDPVGEARTSREFYVNWLPELNWSLDPAEPEATVPFVLRLDASDREGNATVANISFSGGDPREVEGGYRLLFALPGTLTVTVTLADEQGEQVEQTFEVVVKPYGLPDGAVRSLTWEGSDTAGKVGRLVVNLTNLGARPLAAEVLLSIDGRVMQNWLIDLAPGESTELIYTWRAIAGRHQMAVTLVAEGEQSDTSNDHAETTVAIKAEQSGWLPGLSTAAAAAALVAVASRGRRRG